MLSRIKEDRIREEGQAKALKSDYDIIKTLRAELNLPSTEITQFDMSPYLTRIKDYRHDVLGKHDWSRDFIWRASSIKNTLKRELRSDTLSTIWHGYYEDCIEQIRALKSQPMAKSRGTSHLDPVYATHLSRVFVDNQGNATQMLKDDHAQSVCFGLVKIHKRSAICRHQESNVKVLGQCGICAYTADNHDSVNNHIRMHYRMGLIFSFCYRIELTMEAMVVHGDEVRVITLPSRRPKKTKWNVGRSCR